MWTHSRRQEFYELDYPRRINERVNYSLIWQAGNDVVGFSSVDQIDYGTQAFMHLHIVNRGHRRAGMGVHFVKKSAAIYFRVLELRQLCQPNVFNFPTGAGSARRTGPESTRRTRP